MISIVVPVFNEQDVLPQFYQRIYSVIKQINTPYELIFVNDGSSDRSMEIIIDIIKNNNSVKSVEFSRNFGHQAAIAAGLDYARGDAVITLDADLQHPPELIPELIKTWQQGYDIVYTCRKDTVDSNLFKKFTSTFFYKFINSLSNLDIPAGAADFRLMDKRVVNAFRSMNEHRLFLRGLVSWMGYRQIGMAYDAPARYAGKSKYSLIRMVRLAVDGITSFSSIPLYLSSIMGIIISMLSFIYAAYVIYSWLFTNRNIEGWTSLMVVVLFMGGIQLITLGILGTYLGRIYDETKGRPRYLISHSYGFNE